MCNIPPYLLEQAVSYACSYECVIALVWYFSRQPSGSQRWASNQEVAGLYIRATGVLLSKALDPNRSCKSLWIRVYTKCKMCIYVFLDVGLQYSRPYVCVSSIALASLAWGALCFSMCMLAAQCQLVQHGCTVFQYVQYVCVSRIALTSLAWVLVK